MSIIWTDPQPLFKVEVIADSSGEWGSNGKRFATEAEAREYGRDLANRWILVRQWRVVVAEEVK